MERLWNHNYIKVMIANFMLYFAFYVLTPLLPIYLNEYFAASKDTIGMVLSGYTVAALIIRPFSGYLVDSFDRKHILLIFFSLFAACFIGYFWAGTLLVFAIVRTLHGAPFGAVTVANSTCAIDVLPSSRRNEGIGYYGLSNNLAMAIAPSFGLYIYHILQDFKWLFGVALITAFIGLAVLTTLETNSTRRPVQTNKKLSLDRFFLTRAWLLAINIALFGFCFGVLSNYLAIYSKEKYGVMDGTGTYFMLLSVGLFLSRLQGAKALRKGYITRNTAHGMLLSLLGYTLFIAMPFPYGYYISAILIGLGNGHMYPGFLNMFINVAHHNERGTANSSILTSWDFGFGIGIVAGGMIAELFDYTAAFWMVAVVNGIGVLLFFTAARRFFLKHNLNEDVF